ncbi:tryptophan-rich sensory protein [Streptomyces goshikiensis]|uniref:Tryptophan-rich sensory protein n=1 Tax=Streptomyces goshikiensis TaxID=1942 RepID=A0ABZ1RCJ7_9ACTN|nr:tryptophan-rich sensory protein [Streptomyces goshikiensis]
MRTSAPSRRPAGKRNAAAVAVAAAAAAGSVVIDAYTDWYRGLNRPARHAPSGAYGLVWTPLYASIAFAAGHAPGRARGRLARCLCYPAGRRTPCA